MVLYGEEICLRSLESEMVSWPSWTLNVELEEIRIIHGTGNSIIKDLMSHRKEREKNEGEDNEEEEEGRKEPKKLNHSDRRGLI